MAERQITQDLLALTHAVCHLADRVHWLAILRAPWCGLTLADLHQLVGDTTSHTIWELMCDSAICQQLSTDGQNRLQKVRQVLDSTLHKHHHQRLSRRVYQAWLALGGAQCVTGEEDIQIAHNFFTQLDQIVGNDIDAVMQLSKDIQNLYMDSDGGVSSKQGIQLMTIHKAKGLEFDCVILMGMGESTHGDRTNKPLILWDTVEGNLLASSYIPQRYHAGDKAETSVYSYLERMENERMAYETMRLLYVALTRAKRVLHLQGSIKLKQADSDIVPVKSSFLSALWQTLEPDFLRATPLSSPIQPSAAAFSPRLVRMLESTDTPYQSASTGWDKKESEYPAQEIDTLEKFVGRLAHIYLELMVKEGQGAWSAQRLRQLEPAMHHWFVRHTALPASQGVERLLVLLINTVTSPEGQWLLMKRESDACEWRVRIASELYILDRTFIDDGTRWIIDYKTDAISSTMTAQQMMASLADKYQRQVDKYGEYFLDEGYPIQKALFSLALGKLILY